MVTPRQKQDATTESGKPTANVAFTLLQATLPIMTTQAILPSPGPETPSSTEASTETTISTLASTPSILPTTSAGYLKQSLSSSALMAVTHPAIQIETTLITPIHHFTTPIAHVDDQATRIATPALISDDKVAAQHGRGFGKHPSALSFTTNENDMVTPRQKQDATTESGKPTANVAFTLLQATLPIMTTQAILPSPGPETPSSTEASTETTISTLVSTPSILPTTSAGYLKQSLSSSALMAVTHPAIQIETTLITPIHHFTTPIAHVDDQATRIATPALISDDKVAAQHGRGFGKHPSALSFTTNENDMVTPRQKQDATTESGKPTANVAFTLLQATLPIMTTQAILPSPGPETPSSTEASTETTISTLVSTPSILPTTSAGYLKQSLSSSALMAVTHPAIQIETTLITPIHHFTTPIAHVDDQATRIATPALISDDKVAAQHGRGFGKHPSALSFTTNENDMVTPRQKQDATTESGKPTANVAFTLLQATLPIMTTQAILPSPGPETPSSTEASTETTISTLVSTPSILPTTSAGYLKQSLSSSALMAVTHPAIQIETTLITPIHHFTTPIAHVDDQATRIATPALISDDKVAAQHGRGFGKHPSALSFTTNENDMVTPRQKQDATTESGKPTANVAFTLLQATLPIMTTQAILPSPGPETPSSTEASTETTISTLVSTPSILPTTSAGYLKQSLSSSALMAVTHPAIQIETTLITPIHHFTTPIAHVDDQATRIATPALISDDKVAAQHGRGFGKHPSALSFTTNENDMVTPRQKQDATTESGKPTANVAFTLLQATLPIMTTQAILPSPGPETPSSTEASTETTISTLVSTPSILPTTSAGYLKQSLSSSALMAVTHPAIQIETTLITPIHHFTTPIAHVDDQATRIATPALISDDKVAAQHGRGFGKHPSALSFTTNENDMVTPRQKQDATTESGKPTANVAFTLLQATLPIMTTQAILPSPGPETPSSTEASTETTISTLVSTPSILPTTSAGYLKQSLSSSALMAVTHPAIQIETTLITPIHHFTTPIAHVDDQATRIATPALISDDKVAAQHGRGFGKHPSALSFTTNENDMVTPRQKQDATTESGKPTANVAFTLLQATLPIMTTQAILPSPGPETPSSTEARYLKQSLSSSALMAVTHPAIQIETTLITPIHHFTTPIAHVDDQATRIATPALISDDKVAAQHGRGFGKHPSALSFTTNENDMVTPRQKQDATTESGKPTANVAFTLLQATLPIMTTQAILPSPGPETPSSTEASTETTISTLVSTPSILPTTSAGYLKQSLSSSALMAVTHPAIQIETTLITPIHHFTTPIAHVDDQATRIATPALISDDKVAAQHGRGFGKHPSALSFTTNENDMVTPRQKQDATTESGKPTANVAFTLLQATLPIMTTQAILPSPGPETPSSTEASTETTISTLVSTPSILPTTSAGYLKQSLSSSALMAVTHPAIQIETTLITPIHHFTTPIAHVDDQATRIATPALISDDKVAAQHGRGFGKHPSALSFTTNENDMVTPRQKQDATTESGKPTANVAFTLLQATLPIMTTQAILPSPGPETPSSTEASTETTISTLVSTPSILPTTSAGYLKQSLSSSALMAVTHPAIQIETTLITPIHHFTTPIAHVDDQATRIATPALISDDKVAAQHGRGFGKHPSALSFTTNENDMVTPRQKQDATTESGKPTANVAFTLLQATLPIMTTQAILPSPGPETPSSTEASTETTISTLVSTPSILPTTSAGYLKQSLSSSALMAVTHPAIQIETTLITPIHHFTTPIAHVDDQATRIATPALISDDKVAAQHGRGFGKHPSALSFTTNENDMVTPRQKQDATTESGKPTANVAFTLLQATLPIMTTQAILPSPGPETPSSTEASTETTISTLVSTPSILPTTSAGYLKQSLSSSALMAVTHPAIQIETTLITPIHHFTTPIAHVDDQATRIATPALISDDKVAAQHGRGFGKHPSALSFTTNENDMVTPRQKQDATTESGKPTANVAFTLLQATLPIMTTQAIYQAQVQRHQALLRQVLKPPFPLWFLLRRSCQLHLQDI
ncbi:mucin-5B [Folsomia candida]|uniref:mucin-5B n=1 Tax=Folsomia candida TaxID=158441 RepID=UPI000B8FEE92|nr:mucin-5B [Folsomia candida]